MAERRRKMKKKYVTPKVEMLDFDYTDTVVASGTGPATTDQSTTEWYTCNWRYVDVQSLDGTVCGPVPST